MESIIENVPTDARQSMSVGTVFEEAISTFLLSRSRGACGPLRSSRGAASGQAYGLRREIGLAVNLTSFTKVLADP